MPRYIHQDNRPPPNRGRSVPSMNRGNSQSKLNSADGGGQNDDPMGGTSTTSPRTTSLCGTHSSLARTPSPAGSKQHFSGDTANVVVGVRCRKFKPSEDGDSGVAVHMDDEGNVAVQVPGKASHAFAFDKCFQPESSQRDVYHDLGVPLVKNALNGYNSSLLAYGATGSGKTYSMFNTSDEVAPSGLWDGSAREDDMMAQSRSTIASATGLVPRLLAKILEQKQKKDCGGGDYSGSTGEVDLSLDIVEVYLEECFDLVHDRTKIVVAGTNRDGYYCVGLKPTPVRNFQHAMELIAKAQKNRSVAATALNDYSSRAHTLVIAEVRTKHDDGWRTAKLLFADLAGSERIKVAKTEAGKALDEARNINLSLMALGSCVEAAVRNYQIGAPDRNIPHFRDSTLTKLLKECIGGNSRTSILVTVAPGTEHLNNTVHSLRFGNRAKDLKNNAAMNLVKEEEGGPDQNAKDVKKAAHVIMAVQQAMHLKINIRIQQVQREEAKARFNLHKELKAEYVKIQREQMHEYIRLRQALALKDAGAGGIYQARDVKLPRIDSRFVRKPRLPTFDKPSPTRASSAQHLPSLAAKPPRKPASSRDLSKQRRKTSPAAVPTLPDIKKQLTKPISPKWARKKANPRAAWGNHEDPVKLPQLPKRGAKRSVSPASKFSSRLKSIERQEELRRQEAEREEQIAFVALTAAEARGVIALAKKTTKKSNNDINASSLSMSKSKRQALHPSNSLNPTPRQQPHPPKQSSGKASVKRTYRKSAAIVDESVMGTWVPPPEEVEKKDEKSFSVDNWTGLAADTPRKKNEPSRANQGSKAAPISKAATSTRGAEGEDMQPVSVAYTDDFDDPASPDRNVVSADNWFSPDASTTHNNTVAMDNSVQSASTIVPSSSRRNTHEEVLEKSSASKKSSSFRSRPPSNRSYYSSQYSQSAYYSRSPSSSYDSRRSRSSYRSPTSSSRSRQSRSRSRSSSDSFASRSSHNHQEVQAAPVAPRPPSMPRPGTAPRVGTADSAARRIPPPVQQTSGNNKEKSSSVIQRIERSRQARARFDQRLAIAAAVPAPPTTGSPSPSRSKPTTPAATVSHLSSDPETSVVMSFSASERNPDHATTLMNLITSIETLQEKIISQSQRGSLSDEQLAQLEDFKKLLGETKLKAANTISTQFVARLKLASSENEDEEVEMKVKEFLESLVAESDIPTGNLELLTAIIEKVDMDYPALIEERGFGPMAASDSSMGYVKLFCSIPDVKFDIVELLSAAFFNQSHRIPLAYILLQQPASVINLSDTDVVEELLPVWQEFFEDVASGKKAIPREDRKDRLPLLEAMLRFHNPTMAVDIEVEGGDGMSILFRALSEGDDELVLLLLQHRASSLKSVNTILPGCGMAPVHAAVLGNKVDNLKHLVEAVPTIDLQLLTAENSTPFELAENLGRDEKIIEYLKDRATAVIPPMPEPTPPEGKKKKKKGVKFGETAQDEEKDDAPKTIAPQLGLKFKKNSFESLKFLGTLIENNRNIAPALHILTSIDSSATIAPKSDQEEVNKIVKITPLVKSSGSSEYKKSSFESLRFAGTLIKDHKHLAPALHILANLVAATTSTATSAAASPPDAPGAPSSSTKSSEERARAASVIQRTERGRKGRESATSLIVEKVTKKLCLVEEEEAVARQQADGEVASSLQEIIAQEEQERVVAKDAEVKGKRKRAYALLNQISEEDFSHNNEQGDGEDEQEEGIDGQYTPSYGGGHGSAADLAQRKAEEKKFADAQARGRVQNDHGEQAGKVWSEEAAERRKVREEFTGALQAILGRAAGERKVVEDEELEVRKTIEAEYPESLEPFVEPMRLDREAAEDAESERKAKESKERKKSAYDWLYEEPAPDSSGSNNTPMY